MMLVLIFLQWYNNQGEKFLDHILTGDKTWVSYSNIDLKTKIHGVEA
jgi:hypothetical protein